jgi:hypothetical protein
MLAPLFRSKICSQFTGIHGIVRGAFRGVRDVFAAVRGAERGGLRLLDTLFGARRLNGVLKINWLFGKRLPTRNDYYACQMVFAAMIWVAAVPLLLKVDRLTRCLAFSSNWFLAGSVTQLAEEPSFKTS